MIEPVPVKELPHERGPIAWEHVLPWMMRDQESRFAGLVEWRDPSSESESPRLVIDDKHVVLRALSALMSDEEGEALRIPISEDGHFWVTAKLNGRDVRFMVDSGASITTVSRNIAEAAGMPTDGYKGIVSTANGDAPVTRSQAQLQIGTIDRPQLTVHINEQDDVNLLGMNFLSSLNGWRVEGNYLVLQP